MKAEELKTKTADELNGLLLDLKKEQLNLRFQLSQGQLENSARVRAVRRNIARVQTFLKAGSEAGGAAKAKKAKTKPAAEKAAAKKPAKKKSAA